jgi:hypothetical protein
MEKQNITLDFTAKNAVEGIISTQELAIMPASLAKKLLKDYAKKLVTSSSYNIISSFKCSIDSNTDSIESVMGKCADFIQERTLIENCSKENWEVFSVIPTTETIAEVPVVEDLAKH